MKIFIVSNPDGIILGVFDEKIKALDLVDKGLNRWHEIWEISKVEINSVEPWILRGSESYRRAKSKSKSKADL